MIRDSISLNLKLAFKEAGCPICYLRSHAEGRYIRSLLHEYVNDWSSRRHIVESLGYCPRHVWQTGLFEAEKYGSPLGNTIIYEHLTRVVSGRMARYAQRVARSSQSAWRRWLHRLLPRLGHFPLPDELRPQARCRVCQVGDNTESTHLQWLLDDLSLPEDHFRHWYATSDGLCLSHLRQALGMADRSHSAAVEFLLGSTQERLKVLQRDLGELDRKHSWQHRHEEKSESEQNSWLRALNFFGGNPEDNLNDG